MSIPKGQEKVIISPAASVTSVEILPGIKERDMDINLTIDNMFMNMIIFVMKISKNNRFITAEYIPSRTQEVILATMEKIPQ